MLDLKTTTSISKLKYIEILKILVQKLKKVTKKTNKKNDAYFANCKFRIMKPYILTIPCKLMQKVLD